MAEDASLIDVEPRPGLDALEEEELVELLLSEDS